MQQLKAYKLKQDSSYRDLRWVHFEVNPNGVFILLGEVSSVEGGAHHYVFMDLKTGRILPGMWHIEDFEEASEEDL